MTGPEPFIASDFIPTYLTLGGGSAWTPNHSTVPVTFAATTRATPSASPFWSFNMANVLDFARGVSDIAFPWYEARNAQEIREDTIRARETVELAQLGFTTGRAQLATVPRGAQLPSINLGGGVGSGFNIGRYAPLLLLAVVAAVALRR